MRRASAACAAALLAVAARADDAPLAKNPFVRPPLVELAAPESVAAAPPPLEVRAVLSAGDASLVDVGGRIVRVGDEVDGYRLVAVSEEGARFVKEGHSFDVPLQARAVLAPEAPVAVAEEAGDAN